MAVRKRGYTGNWNRKHYIALRGDVAVEEAMDVSLIQSTVSETDGRSGRNALTGAAQT